MTQTTSTDGRVRATRAVRKGLEWTADVGFRRVLPAMRAGFASLRRTARRRAPPVETRGADANRGEVDVARRRATRSLTELTEVDRAEQAVAESLAAIEEELEGIDAADASDARRSIAMLARQRDELSAARDEILVRHRRHLDELSAHEGELERSAPVAEQARAESSRSMRPSIVDWIFRAGNWLTDRVDDLTSAIERRLPFLRRRTTSSTRPAQS